MIIPGVFIIGAGGYCLCAVYFLDCFSGTADKGRGVYHSSFISIFREGNITFSGVKFR